MSIKFLVNDNDNDNNTNDTIDWKNKKITIRHNIKYLYITINHYFEHIYISKKLSKIQEIFYKWSKFIDYWNTNILEFNKAFNIEFNNLILNTDYSLIPLYVTNENIIISIIILNKNIIKSLKNLKLKERSYSFLSNIEPYNIKYNLIYGILNKDNRDNFFKNKEFIIETKINNKIKKHILPLKYILQNGMNYIPKLEINIIKKSSQNLLNP